MICSENCNPSSRHPKSHTAVLVEVFRDGLTSEADCVNLGKFVIAKGADPVSLAQAFGEENGLTANQVKRLEEKLRINMQTIFGEYFKICCVCFRDRLEYR